MSNAQNFDCAILQNPTQPTNAVEPCFNVDIIFIVSIFIMCMLGINNPIIVLNQANQSIGDYSYNVNVQSLPFGFNTVIFLVGNITYSFPFIRQ